MHINAVSTARTIQWPADVYDQSPKQNKDAVEEKQDPIRNDQIVYHQIH